MMADESKLANECTASSSRQRAARVMADAFSRRLNIRYKVSDRRLTGSVAPSVELPTHTHATRAAIHNDATCLLF